MKYSIKSLQNNLECLELENKKLNSYNILSKNTASQMKEIISYKNFMD